MTTTTGVGIMDLASKLLTKVTFSASTLCNVSPVITFASVAFPPRLFQIF